MPRTVLIDGDIFVYQASAAHEYEAQWDTWLWTLHANLDAAVATFDAKVQEVTEALKADRVVVALTDGVNWRKSVMPSYKHHRVKTRKPVCYQALRDYAAETREVFLRPTLEGDDILGILATHPHLIAGEKIIVSIDKDMQTIPGLHVNFGKVVGGDYESAIHRITPEEADRFHLLQALAGDQTDGYPGCPGVGMQTAVALLDEGRVLEPHEHTVSRGPRKGEVETRWEPGREGTPWEIVVSAFESKGLSEHVALQNARVARICRSRDYDFTNKEVRLWTP